MGTVTDIKRTRFNVGDLVHHRLFGYRGVVADVDPDFGLTDAWYEAMAKSRPPKDKPWYQVLVHASDHTTYVAERNLERDTTGRPVDHPLVARLFSRFEDGRYLRDHKAH